MPRCLFNCCCPAVERLTEIACRGLISIAVFFIFSGCSAESDPEIITAAFLEKVEEAFENRSQRALRKLISRQYVDSQNRDKNEILAIGTAYIMGSRSIYLFTDLESARFYGDGQVQATVLAAFAARPVSERTLLSGINTDIYWFEIELTTESGDWKLTRSDWRPAMLDDVLSD